ncbi:MAG: glycosyltransferase family 2 protein, partial [Lentisphaeria bacterium]|nr:glycosyltransferase family 2 protein [Lentisphaeria bacterium]
MKKETLIVVMPVYNEQDCIGYVIDKWRNELEKLSATCQYTLHVYNDGSKDHTWQVLESLPRQNLVLHNKQNSGHGPTILQAYKELCTEADWIFQTDSDDELSPEYFPALWEKRNDYDLLCGRRTAYQQPLPRKIISMVSRLSVKILFGNKVTDVNNPYRLMRTQVFAPLFNEIPENTFAPNVILSGLAALKKNRIRLFEIPVVPVSRKTGVVSIRKWKLVKAAISSFFQTFAVAMNESRGTLIFLFVLILSFLLKFYSSKLGKNFDFDSYCIVKEIVKKGGNVYTETARYNYGPVWFYILHFLDLLPCISFRIALIGFLSLCDVAIAMFLWNMKFRISALIFLLSPVSIYISGLHNQFDNFAILPALCAVFCLSDKTEVLKEIRTLQEGNILQEDYRQKKILFLKVTAGSILLGLSLCIKHIFIFLPFWFLFSIKGKKEKCLIFFLPLLLFSSSFLPFIWKELFTPEFSAALSEAGKQLLSGNPGSAVNGFFASLQENSPVMYNIWKNVFAYQSYDNKIFYKYFLPGIFQLALIPKIIFL